MIRSLHTFILLTSVWSLTTIFWVWEYYEGGVESIWHLMIIFSFSVGLFFYRDKAKASFLYFLWGLVCSWLISSLSLGLYSYGYAVFSGIELGNVSVIGYASAGPFTPNFWMAMMAVTLFSNQGVRDLDSQKIDN